MNRCDIGEPMDLKGKNVYLSGPITGKLLHNAPAFAEAHAMLREMGAGSIYNPSMGWLREGSEHSHEWYMLRCLNSLSNGCGGRPFYDAIVLLDGYEGSVGSRVELEVAESIGVQSITMSELRNMWGERGDD